MSTVQTHPLVDDYLRRLHAASWVLSPDRRNEVVSEIREHIEDALRAGGTRDEVAIRNVLERSGAPEGIVAAAVDGQPGPAAGPMPRRGEPAARRVGALEIASITTLAVGGVIVPVIGVVVGVVLAWASALWTRFDKLVATALPAAFVVIPSLAFAGRHMPLGGWLSGLPGPFSGALRLFTGPMELLWSGLFLGPLLGGVLAATYLAIQANGRARRTD